MDTSTDHNTSGTRSLPETPRISSARRSDVDYHHRLSLQINKENNNAVGFSTEDLDFSKLSALRRKQLRVHEDHSESSKSPGHYARQIVKQAKESVSRRVGLDITNTCRNREYNQKSRDELVKQLKSKKVSKGLAKLDDQVSRGKNYSSSSSSNNSCSPRLRFSTDSKSTSTTTTATTPTTTLSTSKDQSFHISRPLLITSSTSASPAPFKVSAKSKPLQERSHRVETKTSFQKSRSSKKAGREGFGPRLQKIQEETFVRSSTATRTNSPDKKCKKTPLSNSLLNLNIPTFLSVKKTPISPKQVHNNNYSSFLLKPFSHLCFLFLFSFKKNLVLFLVIILTLCFWKKQSPGAEVSDNAQESKRRWSQLSSSQSQKYQRKTESNVLEPRDTTTNDVVVVVTTMPNGSTTPTSRGGGGGGSDLHQYISRILFRTGIAKTSHVSFTNWFSPSHPLDPSIFYRLENSFYLQDSTTFTNLSPQFRLRSNRRLIFDVVDEILVEILRPYMNLKPWINNSRTRGRSSTSDQFWIMHGSQLIDTLCLKVESFPSKDCQVLEDIDGLIDRDLPKLMKIQTEMAFEEEGEGLVMEIERDILDTLVRETTVLLLGTFT